MRSLLSPSGKISTQFLTRMNNFSQTGCKRTSYRKATTVGKSFNKIVGFEKIRADVPDGCDHTPTIDSARRRTVDRAIAKRERIDALAQRVKNLTENT